MLIDSNIVILSVQPPYANLRQFIKTNAPLVSAVSYVEALGFHQLPATEKTQLEQFFAGTTVLPITQDILDQAVALRQQRKMGLGDALIAATCLINQETLATANMNDFSWVSNLTIVNPLAPVPLPPSLLAPPTP